MIGLCNHYQINFHLRTASCLLRHFVDVQPRLHRWHLGRTQAPGLAMHPSASTPSVSPEPLLSDADRPDTSSSMPPAQARVVVQQRRTPSASSSPILSRCTPQSRRSATVTGGQCSGARAAGAYLGLLDQLAGHQPRLRSTATEQGSLPVVEQGSLPVAGRVGCTAAGMGRSAAAAAAAA